MKVTVGRIAMDNAVELVSHALPTKDFGDATSGVLMEVNEDNPKELILMANSLDVFIKTKVALTEKADSGVIVPAGKILKNVVGNLKSLKNPIEIEYDSDENILNLSCGKEYSGSIAHYDSVGFVMPANDDDISKLPKMPVPVRIIKKALSEVAFACGKDKTHIFMTGMYFDQSSDGMNIVGSDALRMSIIRFNSKINNPKSVILPVNFLDLFKKILTIAEIDDSAIINFHIDDENNMAYFINDNVTFGFQTYGQDYISSGYNSFLIEPNDCAIRICVNRESFLSKLDLAISHNTSVQDAVIFGLESSKKGSLKSKISSSSSNVNTFDIPFPISKLYFKGEKAKKFSVNINPSFFYDVLSKLGDKEIEIGLVDSKKGPVVVYSTSEKNINGNFLHIFSIE